MVSRLSGRPSSESRWGVCRGFESRRSRSSDPRRRHRFLFVPACKTPRPTPPRWSVYGAQRAQSVGNQSQILGAQEPQNKCYRGGHLCGSAKRDEPREPVIPQGSIDDLTTPPSRLPISVDEGSGSRVYDAPGAVQGVAAGFSQTETCLRLSFVNGSRFHPLQRSRRRIPASCAIRSSSEGHVYRKGTERRSTLPSTISK
jgi:hypothetical protein